MNESSRLALVIWLVVLSQAFGQWHKAGQFPAGHYYTENELQGLVGTKIAQPSYLIGSFLFLNSSTDKKLDLFTSWSKGLSDPNGVSFSGIFVGVIFHGNRPPLLKAGKAIEPNEKDPLNLIQVIKGPMENSIVAITDSWSEPEQTGNGN